MEKELRAEIRRVEDALNRTQSPKLKRDYTKYLQKLRRKLWVCERKVAANG